MTKAFAIALLKQDIQNSKQKISYYHNEMGIEALDLAIKALEQQPSEDCISRAEALRHSHIEYDDDGEGHRVVYVEDIEELPSVTPKGVTITDFADRCRECGKQTRWIPVSERLPEEDGFYLATCDGEICGEDEPISCMAEFENGKWVDDEDDYQCVLAWMPLPEPYKAESED